MQPDGDALHCQFCGRALNPKRAARNTSGVHGCHGCRSYATAVRRRGRVSEGAQRKLFYSRVLLRPGLPPGEPIPQESRP